MDLFRALFGVGVAVFMMVAPHLGLPYMQAIPIVGDQQALQAQGEGGDTLARMTIEIGPRVSLETLDSAGNRSQVRVLWFEVEGSKLDAKGQGQGKLQRARFAAAAPGGLLMGNETLPLRPGDELTIEGFEGKWAYLPDGMVGVLRMQGSVLAARVGEKGLRPLGTQEESIAPGWALSGQPNIKGNVSVKAGRTTFVSTEASQGDEVVKHIKARDIRINGAKVPGTKWGEGPLDSVSFTVAGPGLLKGEQGDRALVAGERLDVTDFIGAYVVFFTANDEGRIALEGYAGSVHFGQGSAAPSALSNNRAPIPGFDWSPTQPRAGERVKFMDRSTDLDGVVQRREWRFGRGQGSFENSPSHAFEQPGIYPVTLIVTDNHLVSSSTTQNISILAVPPKALWSSTPSQPTTAEAVQFVDESIDLDGRVSAWAWDFGDGERSSAQHPSHRFPQDGAYTVKLTAFDDSGLNDTLTKTITVKNRPPLARFSWLPEAPLSGQSVQFRDGSTDSDGRIVSWMWDFGDGARSEEQNPAHAFARKGGSKVTLTVRDDDGAASTYESLVDVRNRAPVAAFSISPDPPAEGQPAHFSDLSADPDGRITERVWSFGDGSISTQDAPTHTYLSGGNLTVSLTVKDDDGARNTALRNVQINRRPIASFVVLPTQPNTQAATRFNDTSVDPDGRLASWRWEFGDGNASDLRHPEHRFGRAGTYLIKLTVTDEQGGIGIARRPLNVSNTVPLAEFSWTPRIPAVGQDVTFVDASSDPDGSVASWAWAFGDGDSAAGRAPVHRYRSAGAFPVTLTVTDNDGISATRVQTLQVNQPPVAAFSLTPNNPATTSDVVFTDSSSDADGRIASWAWDFGDGGGSTERSPVHRYANAGAYAVKLIVTDDQGATALATRPLIVGSLVPVAAFEVATARPVAGSPVQFTDLSRDADGAVRAWRWDFGDGAQSVEQHPTHVYPTTGIYRVRLNITDDSGKTATTDRNVRILAAGPLEVAFAVVYPDGQPVDLTRPTVLVDVRDTVSGVRLEKGGARPLIVDSAGNVRGTFAEGEWAPADVVYATVRMVSPHVETTRTYALPMDGDLGVFVLRMPLVGRIGFLPSESRVDNNVFTDPLERVAGTLTVTWKDGTPVRGDGAQVLLTYDWEQLGTISYPVPALDSSKGRTAADGTFPFAVPYTLGLPEGPGSYLPGQYRISAVANVVGIEGLLTWRAPLVFQEDPFGLRGALQRR